MPSAVSSDVSSAVSSDSHAPGSNTGNASSASDSDADVGQSSATYTSTNSADSSSNETQSVSSCSNPIRLECGDRLNHDTAVNGQADMLSAYGCTARAESGRETIYSFVTLQRCEVEVRLSELTVDLDLFSVEDCGPFSEGECSSTPLDIQDGEQIAFSTLAGVPRYVVVDGYSAAEGTYAIAVDCLCDGD